MNGGVRPYRRGLGPGAEGLGKPLTEAPRQTIEHHADVVLRDQSPDVGPSSTVEHLRHRPCALIVVLARQIALQIAPGEVVVVDEVRAQAPFGWCRGPTPRGRAEQVVPILRRRRLAGHVTSVLRRFGQSPRTPRRNSSTVSSNSAGCSMCGWWPASGITTFRAPATWLSSRPAISWMGAQSSAPTITSAGARTAPRRDIAGGSSQRGSAPSTGGRPI